MPAMLAPAGVPAPQPGDEHGVGAVGAVEIELRRRHDDEVGAFDRSERPLGLQLYGDGVLAGAAVERDGPHPEARRHRLAVELLPEHARAAEDLDRRHRRRGERPLEEDDRHVDDGGGNFASWPNHHASVSDPPRPDNRRLP
jgi:hypothetical protein